MIINNNNNNKSGLKFTIMAMTACQSIGADIIMINNLKQVERREPGETSSRGGSREISPGTPRRSGFKG